MYTGAFLMLAELLMPGFVVFFFGLSSATVGLIRFALGEAFTPTWQLVAFSAFSVLYLLFLRRWLKTIFTGDVETSSADFANEAVGRVGQVTAPIAPPLPGRIMLGDAEWEAVADTAIPAGANVKVVARENLTMKVEAL